jgi:hypothetical protein
MISSSTKIVLVALGAFLLLAGPVSGSGIPWGKIDDVKLSPNGRRVSIQVEGHVEHPRTLVKRNPSRLIIDFETAKMESVPTPMVIDHRPIREIRLGKLKKGTRVVLDFGGYSVPDYGIRRLGDYYIIFLGQSKLLGKASAKPARTAPRSGRVAKKQVQRSKIPGHWAAEPATSGTRLKIGSARVVDGMIVLHVSDMNRPSRTYRIKLGVDLDQAGFTTAVIRPLRRKSSASRVPAKTSPQEVQASQSPIYRGPRKTGS